MEGKKAEIKQEKQTSAAELAEKERKAAEKAARKAEFEAKFAKEKIKIKEKPTGKSNAELKAERRAQQDAQRAAKSAGGTISKDVKSIVTKPIETLKTGVKIPTRDCNQKESTPPCLKTETAKKKPKDRTANDKLYSHLARRSANIDDIDTSKVPPIVIQVGYRIHNDSIRGSTAKCMALLKAFQVVIENYKPMDNTDLSRELQRLLFDDCLQFLDKCRPLSISQDNAIKHLRSIFNRLTPEMDEKSIRERLVDAIEEFLTYEILCSWKAIVARAFITIADGDVLMTNGCSILMKTILCSARKAGREFRVVVVDTRPRFEGKQLLRELLEAGVATSYILIDTVPYVMKEVTKVIMSAESLFATGYVMGHTGSSQIALIARSANVPVIFCCETYKFSERVHTDCFVHNELGCNREQFFAGVKGKADLKPGDLDPVVGKNLDVLDVVYDLTPSEFISAVITEKGMLPTTSALPVLRVRETR